MKKKSWIILFFISFVVILVYMLTTNMALNYFANRIADRYNLKYEGVGGSIITGIYVNKISFKSEPLADKISVKYNFLELLDASPDISLLRADRLNINNVKSFINSFPSSKESLSLNLKIDKIYLNTAPYNIQDIKANQISINLKNFILTPLGTSVDIDDMNFHINANKNEKYRKLLKDLRFNSLKSKIRFDFKKSKIKVTLKSNISSFFAKYLTLDGSVIYSKDTNLSYKGKLHVGALENLDIKLKKLLNESKITFKGTNKQIHAFLNSDYMKVKYDSNANLSFANLQIHSKEILADKMFEDLNNSVKNTKFSFDVNSYINYKDINNTLFNYKLKSNIVNVDGNYTLGKKLLLSHVALSKDSLLFKLNNNFHPSKLFPINATVKQKDFNFKIKIQNTDYEIFGNYNINDNNFKFISNFFNSHVEILKDKTGYIYSFKTDSLNKFLKATNNIYTLPIKNIEAKMDIKGSFKKRTLSVITKIPYFLYKYDKDKKILIKDFFGEFSLADDLLMLKRYSMKSNLLNKNIVINCKRTSSFDLKKKNYNFDICSNLFDANLSGITKKSLLNFQVSILPKIPISKDLTINLVKTKATFDMSALSLKGKVDALLSSVYAKNISLNADINYTKKSGVLYGGKIDAKDFKNIDQNLSLLLKNSIIFFDGNLNKVDIKSTSKKLKLSEFVRNINTRFKDSKFDINLRSSVNFNDLNNSKILYKINSNLINIDGDYLYKSDEFNLTLKLPKNSLFFGLDKNLHVGKLFPIKVDGKRDKSALNFNAKNTKFNLSAVYNTSNKNLRLKLKSFGILANIEKNAKLYKYKIKIDSLMEAKEAIKSVYKLPDFKVDAQMEINGTYKNNESVFSVKTPWFLYQYADNKFFFIEKGFFNFSYKEMILSLKNYKARSYILENSRKLFSNKTSIFDFSKTPSTINANVNNLIKIKGRVSNGVNLDIKTTNYHLKEPEADIYLDADINYNKDDNSSAISGKVDLLKGVVRYKPKNSYEINDEDIVFVNDKKISKKKKQKRSIFVNIMTKKDMLYVQDKNRVKFKSDITVYQEPGKNVKILGYVEAIDGVYYSDDKKFEIGDGRVMYDGDFLNPFLNLKAYYESKPYKITLLIGGRLGSPLINFSSNPYLSQNDILSILLFGTKFSSAGSFKNISTNQALALFGNTFAKGIVSSIGIKLDRIQLLTTDEGTLGFSVEKQLSKKISIVYQNDLIQSIKMKYKNTKHIETDLTFSPDSSGIEILYK